MASRVQVEKLLVSAERPHLEAALFSTATDGANESLAGPIWEALAEQSVAVADPTNPTSAEVEGADLVRLFSAARIALLRRVLAKYLSDADVREAEQVRVEFHRRTAKLADMIAVAQAAHDAVYQAPGPAVVYGAELLPQASPTDAVFRARVVS